MPTWLLMSKLLEVSPEVECAFPVEESRSQFATILIEHSEKPSLYYSYIPVVPDRSHYRKFDTVSLKDIRRRLDGGYCSPSDVDQIAQELMDDCTIVSRLPC
jgi:hypothetical protein